MHRSSRVSFSAICLTMLGSCATEAAATALPDATLASQRASVDTECTGAPIKELRYDVVADDARTQLGPFRAERDQLVIIGRDRGRRPYALTLRGHGCGDHASVRYSLVRLGAADEPNAAPALVAPEPARSAPPSGRGTELQPPPFELVMAEVLRREPHVEGVVDVHRAKAILLADGLWPDGEPYRLVLTLR